MAARISIYDLKEAKELAESALEDDAEVELTDRKTGIVTRGWEILKLHA
jgi:hypothetical protein